MRATIIRSGGCSGGLDLAAPSVVCACAVPTFVAGRIHTRRVVAPR